MVTSEYIKSSIFVIKIYSPNKFNVRNKIITLSILVLIHISLSSFYKKAIGTIEGKVIDFKKGEPILFACNEFNISTRSISMSLTLRHFDELSATKFSKNEINTSAFRHFGELSASQAQYE